MSKRLRLDSLDHSLTVMVLNRAREQAALGDANIKHRQPILQRLHREPAKHKRHTEHPHTPLRQIIGVVFDVRTESHSYARYHSRHHPQPRCEQPGMIYVPDNRAAEKRCGDIARGSKHGRPKNTRENRGPREA